MDDVRKSLKGCRRQLTLRVKSVEESVDCMDVPEVEACLLLLEDTMAALCNLDTKMSDLCEGLSDADSEKLADEECQKAFFYQKRAVMCKRKAQSFLDSLKDPLKAREIAPTPHVKLEKLSLPSFDGDILTFHAFWETFESRVDSNPRLNTIDKFDYLLSRCKGRAADALMAIPRTSSGYDIAVTTLKRRFG